ncbi:glutamyl-tRNA reductase, partial [Escherichia coli]|nr:glutamyl-tRNA reductase [Escherichia coli]
VMVEPAARPAPPAAPATPNGERLGLAAAAALAMSERALGRLRSRAA